MSVTFDLNIKKSWRTISFFICAIIIFYNNEARAQNTMTYSCTALNVEGNATLKSNPISEDDPDDLAECYSLLTAYLPGNNQFLELRFPAKKGTYHWDQSTNHQSSSADSLAADFYFNTVEGGNSLHANANDFNIVITRYDNTKGGNIEGTFSGTMTAFAAWKLESVQVTIKGSFQTTRTGKSGVECRKLRQSEKLVVRNAQGVINNCVVQPLQKMGWQVKNSSVVPPSATDHPNPYRPLFLCSSVFDLTISPDPNSENGKMINDSIRYYSGRSDMHATVRQTLLARLNSLKIRIGENSPYLKTPFPHDADDKYTQLHVPGSSYAYRLTVPEQGVGSDIPPDYKTFILLGNWNGADMNAATYVNYPFVHKQRGAFLETLTVQILAPAAIADKIIQNVNWQGLKASLTK